MSGAAGEIRPEPGVQLAVVAPRQMQCSRPGRQPRPGRRLRQRRSPPNRPMCGCFICLNISLPPSRTGGPQTGPIAPRYKSRHGGRLSKRYYSSAPRLPTDPPRRGPFRRHGPSAATRSTSPGKSRKTPWTGDAIGTWARALSRSGGVLAGLGRIARVPARP